MIDSTAANMAMRLRLLAATALMVAASIGVATAQTAPAAPAARLAPAPGRLVTEADYEAAQALRIVTAVRVSEPPTVDGRLDEPIWESADPATDFIQRIPNTGEPATEQTEVRFLYDDDTLYVGVTAFDSDPSRLVVKELKEDFDMNGTDVVQLILDSLHDRQTAFALTVNPAGAKRDAQFSQNQQANNDWDGVWDAKVSTGDRAWYIEYAIPFKMLRFTSSRAQEWGLQVSRRVPRRNEESNWSPLPFRFQATRVSMAGTLNGFQDLKQGRNFKVKPYVLAQLNQSRVGDDLRTVNSLRRLKGSDDERAGYDGGFDLKYSLTPSLTFDGTYRTDFAQVEADQQQVNLTRFNLFFPEKRDFFLENAGVFSFGGNRGNFQQGGGNNNNNNQANLVPFFSRRIGLSAAGTAVPIIAGSRITGRINKYDIGMLAMKTDKLDTSPSNNYFVGRLKRNFRSNSWIGMLATSRDSTVDGDFNRVYGTDFHLQFFNKLDVDTFVLRSDTPGKSGGNQARRFQTAWRDDEINAAIEYNAVQPNFVPDVGFVRRSNMSQYSGEFTWLPRIESDTIRNLSFATSVDYFKNATTGGIETRVQDGRLGIQFDNNGSTNFTATRTFDRLIKPFAIRPTVEIPVGDYESVGYAADLNTGNSRKVFGSGKYAWGEFWNGDNRELSGSLGLRLNYHWSVDLNYSRNHVTLPTGEFTSQLVGTRFLFAFTSRSFVNAFFQYNADTHQVSSNIRFNITHHPLSDLYVVYNDTRDTTNGQIAGRAFAVKLTNLFNF
jgi:hypothetical protein